MDVIFTFILFFLYLIPGFLGLGLAIYAAITIVDLISDWNETKR